ncbi:Uma2 family endonuclease [Nocardiopsis alborubida]|uniref:Uma2 family endonuclease n=1 Tax=Nocardiopsis alborubida TaxID=146802 RepID=A0A7X6RPK4_9ACTN|nr:Uma2 family endonuclease [Nocardiopsis alborubida]NKY97930.1 Uma2 family endonuclease [Nocardiopsis alborubida]
MPVSPVAERQSSTGSRYEPLTPPPEGFTADDLDSIPDLPPHTELIDGSLVLVTPQRNFHTVVLSVLDTRLFEQAPDRLRVRREMTLKLGPRQRPEPDLVLVQTQATGGTEQTWFAAEAVELVVEVVSPESELRDRERKPQLYAEAGIPNFWLIEQDRGEAVVFAHELAPTGGYARPTVHRQRLKTSRPFPIDIDLTEIQRR